MQRYIRWSISILLMVALLFSATACVPEPLPGSFVDDLGRTVNIEKVPQRIISLAPSNTEILYSLGLEDKLVGVTEYCNYPEAAKAKPKIGGFTTVDIERVVALKPDLILATSIHKKTVIPALEEVGLTVLALAPETVEGVLDNIILVGKITGKSREANRLVTSLEKRIKTITDKTEALTEAERPRVLYLTWHDPLWTAGSGTLTDDLINKAGGQNIAHDLIGHKTIDLETVIHRNPQVIIAVTGHGGAKDLPFYYVKNEPRLGVTEAVMTGKV
ncbi:MAG: ABC transporter substrate-binding protein, partial [Dehalococcoidales bacterium]|nr:ABC transporter substrate-binding protein [Dehalococcoidales bacterium]